ncbi:MAG: divergent polysaccharide deacetylase family protein [Gammaproteobacteria bacterium]
MSVLLFLLFLPMDHVVLANERVPAIAIIIDDMGKRIRNGERIVNLPGPVACAFLPYAKYTADLAQRAFENNKEILLHLPMQSIYSSPIDPGAITLEMNQEDVRRVVEESLLAVPYVSGVNNHMGSMLTQHPGHMGWLMSALQSNGDYFFIDSRTTAETVARQVAEDAGLPASQRNIFLDHDINRKDIEEQFERLIELAYKNGTAIAIGHPYPQTLDMLEKRLPELDALGINLVSVADIIEMQQERSRWQASLSPSLRAAKSLKQ